MYNQYYQVPNSNNAAWGYIDSTNKFVEFSFMTSNTLNSYAYSNCNQFSIQENSKTLKFTKAHDTLLYYDEPSNFYCKVQKKQATSSQSLPVISPEPNISLSTFSYSVQIPRPQPRDYVVWEWENRDHFEEYSREICIQIEEAFRAGRPEVILDNIRPGVVYKITFVNNVFLQINMQTDYRVRVRRN